MKANIVKEKSYGLAWKVIHVCKWLLDERHYILSRQLLKSGTSIGANKL